MILKVCYLSGIKSTSHFDDMLKNKHEKIAELRIKMSKRVAKYCVALRSKVRVLVEIGEYEY